MGITADGRTIAGMGVYRINGIGQGGAFYVTLPPKCYPNCDGSTAHPAVNVNDFLCFVNRFAAADSYANCDGSTALPVLNVADFICFQQKYAAGCP